MEDDKLTKQQLDEIELAKNLAAAFIAHYAGYKSIDRVKKKYVYGKKLRLYWIELAKHAAEFMRNKELENYWK